MKHIAVLLAEAVEALKLESNSVVIDATFGSGGHARAILSILDEHGTYIGIDADQSALDARSEEIAAFPATTHLICNNFRHLNAILAEYGVSSVDAILADLGWRTEQFVEGTKGFSFTEDNQLLMTYGDPSKYLFTAHDIVNTWEEEHIADVLYGYGEERASRRIAKAIVTARAAEPIETALQLAQIVSDAIPKRFHPKRIHPATRTFQALRIAVNDELGAVADLIDAAIAHLATGGRLAIITFHSIEDRLVKRRFQELARDHIISLVIKKPLVPTDLEIDENPRARSAKLRIIEKL